MYIYFPIHPQINIYTYRLPLQFSSVEDSHWADIENVLQRKHADHSEVWDILQRKRADHSEVWDILLKLHIYVGLV